MDDIDNIINGPDYFYCEKSKCKLRIDICLGRQRANENRKPYKAFPICEECKQGLEIQRKGKGKGDKKPEGTPRKGKGLRNDNCEIYSDCISIAAKHDWKIFNCESCTFFKPATEEVQDITEKTKNKRICETDGCENITLGPNCPYCPSCMAKKANEKKAAGKKKKGSIDTANGKTNLCKTEGCENKAQENGYCMPCNVKLGNHKGKSKKPSEPPIKATEGISDHEPIQYGDNMISVDFTGYEDVLKEIQKLALEDVRPLNYQVVWMLKEAIKGRAAVSE